MAQVASFAPLRKTNKISWSFVSKLRIDLSQIFIHSNACLEPNCTTAVDCACKFNKKFLSDTVQCKTFFKSDVKSILSAIITAFFYFLNSPLKLNLLCCCSCRFLCFHTTCFFNLVPLLLKALTITAILLISEIYKHV